MFTSKTSLKHFVGIHHDGYDGHYDSPPDLEWFLWELLLLLCVYIICFTIIATVFVILHSYFYFNRRKECQTVPAEFNYQSEDTNIETDQLTIANIVNASSFIQHIKTKTPLDVLEDRTEKNESEAVVPVVVSCENYNHAAGISETLIEIENEIP